MVRAYIAVATQWQYNAMGRATGLAYAGVEAALRIEWPHASGARRARLFAGVREVEQALLGAWRENHEQAERDREAGDGR